MKKKIKRKIRKAKRKALKPDLPPPEFKTEFQAQFEEPEIERLKANVEKLTDRRFTATPKIPSPVFVTAREMLLMAILALISFLVGAHFA